VKALELRAPRAGSWLDLGVDEVADLLDRFQILDVREPDELDGELGRLDGAINAPLGSLAQELARFDPEKPTLVVCRSGKRASHACATLAASGFSRVYNLSGGMLAFRGARR